MDDMKANLKAAGVVFHVNEKVEDITIENHNIATLKTNKDTYYKRRTKWARRRSSSYNESILRTAWNQSLYSRDEKLWYGVFNHEALHCR